MAEVFGSGNHNGLYKVLLEATLATENTEIPLNRGTVDIIRCSRRSLNETKLGGKFAGTLSKNNRDAVEKSTPHSIDPAKS